MTLRIRLIWAFAAAALAAPAPAATSETAGQSARERDDSKIVCKTQAKTGTRFQEKICKTRGQWEELRIQQQRDAKEMIDKPLICGGGGNPEGC